MFGFKVEIYDHGKYWLTKRFTNKADAVRHAQYVNSEYRNLRALVVF